MESTGKESVMVKITVDLPVEQVWKYWTGPEHVIHWNNASDEWHTPSATNDLREDGKFVYRMEAKDGSMGFDFFGTYDRVVPHKLIEYTLGDKRKVRIDFVENGEQTELIEIFEAESENPVELQRNGWQAILNNFKHYAEKG